MKADVAGWGQVSVSGPQVSILRAVQVRVMAQTECANKYKGYAPAGIVPGMVCAGDRGYDSCKVRFKEFHSLDFLRKESKNEFHGHR
jgi:hypothetical protein